MAPLAGFDIRRDDVGSGYTEVSPGVAAIIDQPDGYALYPPDGFPDGRVSVWTVPPAVHAITFQVIGSMGGFADRVPDPVANTPVEYARRVLVEPGDQITLCVGSVPNLDNSMVANRGNGPLRGANGTTDSEALFGGAGGGAAALYRGDDMLALSPGGGGYFGSIDTEIWTGPGSVYPAGAPGSESVGEEGTRPSGGGGGGTPGGAAVPAEQPGANGAGVSCDRDPGGPPSPTWDETGLGSGDNREPGPGVRVYFYLPPVNRWHVGLGW
jgi:hypothetical protein